MAMNKAFKWGYIILGAALVIGIMVVLWNQSANTTPVVKIPAYVVPNPNAYDYYVRSVNAIKDNKKIYPATYNIIPHKPRYPGEKPDPIDRVYTLAEKDAILANNDSALRTLREGFKYEYKQPQSTIFSGNWPPYSSFREMARLLQLESKAHELHGDWDGAVNTLIDGIILGNDIPKGGGAFSTLIGEAIQNMTRTGAWDMVKHLSADEAKAAAKRMEIANKRRAPLSDIYTNDKWITVSELVVMFNEKNWQASIHIFTENTDGKKKTIRRLRVMTCSKGKLLRSYVDIMDQVIANSQRPYQEWKPIHADFPCDEGEIIEMMQRLGFGYLYKCETQNALLTVTFALQAYRMEHGQYPDSLSKLTPSYLKKIPIDPFAMKGELKYRRIGDNYVLYSVGPDGKDNGGKAITDPKIAGSPAPGTGAYELKYYVEKNSKGDIVAGTNIQGG